MASVNLETLESSTLEERVKNSIFSKYANVADSYIRDNLKKKGDNFFIPTVQTLVDRSPELEKELIDLYNRKFPMGNTEDIDYEIKLLQASVLDGLVVGINTEKDGEYQIYTANIGAIFGINNESKFNIDKALELNRNRIVHAVRVDIEYNSEDGFTYKLVSLNKNTNLHIVDMDTFEGRFHLVPYIAIQRSLAFFKEMLDDMRILNVKQDKGEIQKSRYITCRKDILIKYSDNEDFAKSLKYSFFPLKGFFYAPVLGASSMTIGLTRIDLLDVCNIKNVISVENISKCSGGLDDMIIESSIKTILDDMYEYDVVGYQRLVDALPNDRGILTGAVYNVDKGVPTPITMIKYYHSLNRKERSIFISLIPNLDTEMKNKKSIINKYEALNPDNYSIEEIKDMLKHGIYKFYLRKKDCCYSTITVTNSKELLCNMYGKDYFAKYESFGIRIYRLKYFIENNRNNMSSLEKELKYCGFPVSEDILNAINAMATMGLSGKALHDGLVSIFDVNRFGRKSTRRSASDENLILARVCFNSMISSGSIDFYRYVDMKKVVSIYRLG